MSVVIGSSGPVMQEPQFSKPVLCYWGGNNYQQIGCEQFVQSKVAKWMLRWILTLNHKEKSTSDKATQKNKRGIFPLRGSLLSFNILKCALGLRKLFEWGFQLLSVCGRNTLLKQLHRCDPPWENIFFTRSHVSKGILLRGTAAPRQEAEDWSRHKLPKSCQNTVLYSNDLSWRRKSISS